MGGIGWDCRVAALLAVTEKRFLAMTKKRGFLGRKESHSDNFVFRGVWSVLRLLLSLRDMLKACRGNHIHFYPHLCLYLFPLYFCPHLCFYILPKTKNYELTTLMAITCSVARIFVFIFFPYTSPHIFVFIFVFCISVSAVNSNPFSTTHKKYFQYYTSRSGQIS